MLHNLFRYNTNYLSCLTHVFLLDLVPLRSARAMRILQVMTSPLMLTLNGSQTEEVGHCMLPYIRDQILELVNESLLVAVL